MVGDRFFPATVASDDPFAADELALPTIGIFRHDGRGAPVNQTNYEFEYSKTIFNDFAVSVGGGYVDAMRLGGGASSNHRIDKQAKSLGEYLGAKYIQAPTFLVKPLGLPVN